MSFLSDSLLRLWRGLNSSAAKSIRFRRGIESVDLGGLPGRTRHELVDATGLRSVVETQDWIVLAADLVLEDHTTVPQRGRDTIEELDDEDEIVATYLVTHPGGQEPFRWVDQFRRLIRIHTIRRG